jgi:ABC-type proline/glycine betaine transport system permease subunit
MATPAQRTVSDVLQDIVANIQEIMRSEFRLAKVEIKQKVQQASGPTISIGVAAAIGFYGLGFLLLAAVYALSLVMALWIAALIVGFALAVIAAVLFSACRSALKRIDPMPEKTVQTVKENVQWTKDRIR